MAEFLVPQVTRGSEAGQPVRGQCRIGLARDRELRDAHRGRGQRRAVPGLMHDQVAMRQHQMQWRGLGDPHAVGQVTEQLHVPRTRRQHDFDVER